MSLGIAINNVTKRFGPRLVLNGITLTVKPGETLALIGPSGGGKSTLLRCLNGLNSFDSGEIRVGPHTLQRGTPAREIRQVRRLFGMIFQDFQLFPHLNVLENVTLAPRRVLGMSVQRCE